MGDVISNMFGGESQNQANNVAANIQSPTQQNGAAISAAQQGLQGTTNSASTNQALGLASQLAQGQGPSVAKANMQAGLSQAANTLGAQGMQGSAASGGLAQNSANHAYAQAAGGAAGQGAVAGAQEQVGNIANLGNLSLQHDQANQGAYNSMGNLALGQSGQTLTQQQAQAGIQQQGAQSQAAAIGKGVSGVTSGLAGLVGK